MQTTVEIQSNLKNVKYYTDKIVELAKRQYEIDFARGNKEGMNSTPGSIRFDCLATIIAQCGEIEFLCSTIEVNLNAAIKQDKHLYNLDYIDGLAEEELRDEV